MLGRRILCFLDYGILDLLDLNAAVLICFSVCMKIFCWIHFLPSLSNNIEPFCQQRGNDDSFQRLSAFRICDDK